MTAQGVIGRDCAWCGLPATGELEVEPARYRTVGVRDPITNKHTTRRVFERAAIVVWVCDTHKDVLEGQSSSVSIPRQTTARGVEQLSLAERTP